MVQVMKHLNSARLFTLLALAAMPARAQVSHAPHHALAAHVIVPHARPFTHQVGTVQITEVNAAVEIVEQVTLKRLA